MKLINKSGISGALLQEVETVIERGSDHHTFELVAIRVEETGYRYCKEIKKTGSTDGILRVQFHTVPDLCRALLQASCSTELLGDGRRSFQEFGYMVDCSRNAVPQIDTLKQLVKLLALMGYSYLGLYLEDTIEVEEEPYLGWMRGGYTKKEIKELVCFAEIFGIEIRPYVQTLAHLNQITRYEQYQEFIDTDDILLVGDERTYRFLDRYLQSVSEAFSSKKINIGMDEAHMVGLGKYLDQHGFRNRMDIMLEHLERVMKICRKYGLLPQMWSDMFFRLAYGGKYYVEGERKRVKVKIPKGLDLVYWDYYSTNEAHYEEMIEMHQSMTDRLCFASGAWKWTGFAAQNRYSEEVGRAALHACQHQQISDVVVTGWGDDGGEASVFSVLPALFADARVAYKDRIEESAFYSLTAMPVHVFLSADLSNFDDGLLDLCEKRRNKKQTALKEESQTRLDEKTQKPICRNNTGKFLLYNDPFLGTFDSVAAEIPSEYYRKAAEVLQSAIQEYGDSTFLYLLQTQEALCRLLHHKAKLGLEIRRAYADKNRKELQMIAEEQLPEIIDETEEFYRRFRIQWRCENKAFGFEVQTMRLGGLTCRLKEVQEEIRQCLKKEVFYMEEVEAKALPFAYMEKYDMRTLVYNRWDHIVTPSVME